MEISAKALDVMSNAKTPEEAYKVFAGAVSEGLGQLLADSLAKALGAASVASKNQAIEGWEKYVKGMTMQCIWGTPGFRSVPSVSITSASSVIGANSKPSIQGGSITIGGTWTF